MPSRRQALAAVGCGLLPALTGCQTTERSPSSGTTTSAGRTSTTTEDATTTTASGGYAVQAKFEKHAYWLRGVGLPPSIAGLPTDEIVALSELDSPTEDAVKTAITDGPYTTTDPSKNLLDGIEDVTLVEYRETHYNVSHTFSTSTLELDMEGISETVPDDRTVAWDGDAVHANETVADAIYTVTPRGTHHPGQPYTTTQFPDVLREFLDRYDYVKSPHGIGELVFSTTERSPPYTVTAAEATGEQLYGREVLEIDSFTRTSRDLVRRTLADRRKTPLGYRDRDHSIFPDEIPDRLNRRLEDESYFVRVGGTIYGFDARHLHWKDLPVEVTATVTDGSLDSDSPIRVELAATNTSSHTAELIMDGIAPFGVLWAYGPSSEHVLRSPEYERSDDVGVEDGSVVPRFQDEVAVSADERVTTTYQFGHDHDRFEPGDYEIPGLIWAKWPTESNQEKYDWRSEIYPYTLTLTVT